jgi:drug/metabolite transporter (DMT)-like permease
VLKTGLLTTIAMLAFAANSVLARLALGAGEIDPLAYTGIRLASGALMLSALLALRAPRRFVPRRVAGTWRGASALLVYAITFSLAYVMLATGTGALILFASVQFGMLGWAVLKGDRPGVLEWLGIGIAFAALAFLVAPGLVTPDPLGAALMVVSGLAWAVYSLLGRGSVSPLADTAGNFVRCLPVGIALGLAGFWLTSPSVAGIGYAVASGALASGVGYMIWYSILPGLTRSSAAFVQLTVPAIAAGGGVLLVGEALTRDLVIALCGILGGVALALIAAERRRARMA